MTDQELNLNTDQWSVDDWKRLQELRGVFLDLSTQARKQKSYWQSLRDLELYDHSFARRIGWKWEYVFEDLVNHNAQLFSYFAKHIKVVDWGCGSGVALEHFLEQATGAASAAQPECMVWDHSDLARQYCIQKFNLKQSSQLSQDQVIKDMDVLLLSHVLNEQQGFQSLLPLIHKARWVLWVEPGSREVSRLLSQARQSLMAVGWSALAPCPTQGLCGMLRPANQRHWCHFFANSPQYVHHSRFWREFAKRLEIDLRRVPLSYLVLTRDAEYLKAHPPAQGLQKTIGQARVYKAFERALVCSAEHPVEEIQIPKSKKKKKRV